MNALYISDRFAAWKHYSWASVNQSHSWRTLHIFKRFAKWNHYSWISANWPSCRTLLQLSECSRREIAIPDNQQIDTLALLHSPYLKVLQLENRSREYQQKVQLPGEHYPYLNVFEAWKCNFCCSAYRPNRRAEQAIFERFQATEQNSLVSANRSPFMTALPISDPFANWIRD